MMLTADQWIPLDGVHEWPLIEVLQREQRAFMKPLRYDARSTASFPNVLLLDGGKVALPLHVTSPFVEPKEGAIKEKLLAGSRSVWVWATDQNMPALPERTWDSLKPPFTGTRVKGGCRCPAAQLGLTRSVCR